MTDEAMYFRHVIKTFDIWSELRSRYCNPKTATLTTKQIALTTYISAILITLKERQYEKAWRLLYHLKSFLDVVGVSNNSEAAISDCFNQLLNNDTKMVKKKTLLEFDLFEYEYVIDYLLF